nr:nuclear transport factor 2 family protein [Kineococcus rhizosphaerae]
MNPDDRLQIHETLARLADAVDAGRFDELDEVFTPDAVYDMSATGLGVFRGRDGIRAAAAGMARSGRAPLAHFVTNVVVTGTDDGATVRSKGLMLMPDGQTLAVGHDDVLRRDRGAWRLSRRTITPVPRPVAAQG